MNSGIYFNKRTNKFECLCFENVEEHERRHGFINYTECKFFKKEQIDNVIECEYRKDTFYCTNNQAILLAQMLE